MSPNSDQLIARVAEYPSGWKIGQLRWAAVARIFLVGSTTARLICSANGQDPDEIKKRKK